MDGLICEGETGFEIENGVKRVKQRLGLSFRGFNRLMDIWLVKEWPFWASGARRSSIHERVKQWEWEL